MKKITVCIFDRSLDINGTPAFSIEPNINGHPTLGGLVPPVLLLPGHRLIFKHDGSRLIMTIEVPDAAPDESYTVPNAAV